MNLLLQRIDLLAIGGDHAAQRELILIELLYVVLRAAAKDRERGDNRASAR
ncbi:MAG: hypothetical protein Q7S58_14895 [Candidatus Binatus sp.]|uniref:hypothetical protein n=1 Tax=Candidatus Binatus sp. TaxID=2811406 RepID=UPI002718EA55|nr:hypothetical protein [Candidatus Binatus sp.]MDO8433690.1 hypothetical protein [Candidatus Binatus sp.]